MKVWSALFMLATLGLMPGALRAQEMDVPAEVQIPLLYKILTFDRKLGDRVPGHDIVIAIVFQTGYRASVLARDQVVEALQHMGDSTITGHRVDWVQVELIDAEALRLALIRSQADVIYVTPLRGVNLDPIKAVARATGITTFTGVPRYVERGLALGVGIAREHPQIIVNLTAARAEGSDFTSQLLRVSKVFEE